jgi:putative transposase
MSAQREQRFSPMPAPKQPDTPAGWHSRGYLPHFDGGEIPQFITFRLADSMPQSLLDRWREELSREQNVNVDAALRKRIELFLEVMARAT